MISVLFLLILTISFIMASSTTTLLQALIKNDTQLVNTIAPSILQHTLRELIEGFLLSKGNASAYFVLIHHLDDPIFKIQNMCLVAVFHFDDVVVYIHKFTIQQKFEAFRRMLEENTRRRTFWPLVKAIDRPYLIPLVRTVMRRNRFDICELLVRRITYMVSEKNPKAMLIAAAKAQHSKLFTVLAMNTSVKVKAEITEDVVEYGFLGRLHLTLVTAEDMDNYVDITWGYLTRNGYAANLLKKLPPRFLDGILRRRLMHAPDTLRIAFVKALLEAGAVHQNPPKNWRGFILFHYIRECTEFDDPTITTICEFTLEAYV